MNTATKHPTAKELQWRIEAAEKRLHYVCECLEASFLYPMMHWMWVLQNAHIIQAEADLAFAELRADIERWLSR